MAWDLDPNHTSVSFSAKHLGLATVRGLFTKVSGDVELDDPNDPTTARGTVTIDAASLNTGNEQRDIHLRSKDFLDVENFPAITFTANSVEHLGDDQYKVDGELTVRGQTRPISLTYEHGGTAADPFGNTKVGGSLTGSINRSDFGLTWNVPLGNGGLLVGDKIKLEIDGQLVETKEAAAVSAEAEAEASRAS
ncbi:MAG: YceI family protein [Candidatus Dormibacteraeota bacterium]|nr:YceI family protein [Candidatus Dormibacteraeota bacterium]